VIGLKLQPFVVTGGTGRYANARGTLAFGKSGSFDTNTYHLTLPA
jgi:hypothetical protein